MKAIAATFFISMLPVVELRGGIPYGVAAGLDYLTAAAVACLGNMVPVPFIILLIRKVFNWMKQLPKVRSLIERLEARGKSKGELVKKYRLVGLILLVAIPLPGTGAWTGALVAAMLDMQLKTAFPAILVGVLIAAAIILTITHGVTVVF